MFRLLAHRQAQLYLTEKLQREQELVCWSLEPMHPEEGYSDFEVVYIAGLCGAALSTLLRLKEKHKDSASQVGIILATFQHWEPPQDYPLQIPHLPLIKLTSFLIFLAEVV